MSGRARRKRRRREIRALQLEHDWRRQRARGVEIRARARACPVQLWAARLPTMHGLMLGDLLIRPNQEVHT